MAEQALTYAEVGATLAHPLPPGHHHLDVRRRVSVSLDELDDFILGWGLHRGAGLSAPEAPATLDATYRLRLGPVPVPVRVVRVLDEPDRRGFVYGTLPGHPEAGEEAFLAEREADGIWVHVRAFSRPATWYARLGGPAGRLVQRVIAERYLRAAERL